MIDCSLFDNLRLHNLASRLTLTPFHVLNHVAVFFTVFSTQVGLSIRVGVRTPVPSARELVVFSGESVNDVSK